MTLHSMLLIRELGRFIRSAPIEAGARWHAWRLDRHQRLTQRHEAALAARLADARQLLATR